MLLKSIKLENFRQFVDEQIDFSTDPDQNVTLIIGENGTVTEVKEWGKRRLAYPINYINEGYYVLVDFEAAAELPAELERRFRIDENILRSIVVRHTEKKSEEA